MGRRGLPEFTAMSRSFRGSTESTATVEKIHTAFGREDYWLHRLATGDAVTLDSLAIHTDHTVAVRYTQHPVSYTHLTLPTNREV